MTETINLRANNDPRDAIHCTVQVLVEGGVVALPMETGYAACVLGPHDRAAVRLGAGHGDIEGILLTRDESQTQDYLCGASAAVRRLMRRCWPGRVDFRFGEYDAALVRQLPEAAHRLVVSEEGLRVCVPAARFAREVQSLVPGPLIAGVPTQPAAKEWGSPQQVRGSLGRILDLIVEDHPTPTRSERPLIRVSTTGWVLEQAGDLAPDDVAHLAALWVVFVCTGNTCRSPMAEGIFRKLAADRLQCRPEELIERGLVAASAGLAAMPGAPASPEAVDVNLPHGIDLRSHVSQPLTRDLLDQADFVLTMTAGHREAIVASRPYLAERVRLLSCRGQDVSDPIGYGREAYERCRVEIAEAVEEIVDDIVSQVGKQRSE